MISIKDNFFISEWGKVSGSGSNQNAHGPMSDWKTMKNSAISKNVNCENVLKLRQGRMIMYFYEDGQLGCKEVR